MIVLSSSAHQDPQLKWAMPVCWLTELVFKGWRRIACLFCCKTLERVDVIPDRIKNRSELRGVDSSGNLNLFARCYLHVLYLSHCLLTLLVHGPGIHTSSLGVTVSRLQNSLGRKRIFCVIYPFLWWLVMQLCINLNEPSQLTSNFSETGTCEGKTMKQKNTSLIGESGHLWHLVSSVKRHESDKQLPLTKLLLFFFFLQWKCLTSEHIKISVFLKNCVETDGQWFWFDSHFLTYYLSFSFPETTNSSFFLDLFPSPVFSVHTISFLIFSLLFISCSSVQLYPLSDCVLCIFSGHWIKSQFFQNWLWRNLACNLATYISFC